MFDDLPEGIAYSSNNTAHESRDVLRNNCTAFFGDEETITYHSSTSICR